jgi:hypothetical protein
MNARIFGVTVLAALLFVESVGAQGFGTIKGRVVWGEAEIPEPAILAKMGDPLVRDSEICARTPLLSERLLIDKKTKGIANVLVYLFQPTGSKSQQSLDLLKRKPLVTLEMKACRMVPRAFVLHTGQKPELKQSDPIATNFHSATFQNPSLNFVALANSSRIVSFDKPELRPTHFRSDIHPWAMSYFMVFDHPFFAVTGVDGEFEIAGVPAGTQAIVAWHEEQGFLTDNKSKGQPVEVKAGGTADLVIIGMNRRR